MREYRARSPEYRERERLLAEVRNARVSAERKANPKPRRTPAPGTPEWERRRAWGKCVQAATQQGKRWGAEINDLRLKDWLEVVDAHQYRCFYCGVEGDLWIDHLVPLSGGGNNTKANVAPACESCNRRKARRSVEQFTNNQCGQGHDLTPENIYRFPKGKKWACRTCRREAFRRYREKQRRRAEAA